MPTVTSPNYWENNTGKLVPLLLIGYVAGGSLIGGIFLGFDSVALRLLNRFDSKRTRVIGLGSVLGGLLLVSGSFRSLFRAAPAPRFTMATINIGGSLLLILGVIGLYARYGQRHWKSSRRGMALIAAGLTVSILGTVLTLISIYAQARTGALSQPTSVLSNIGSLVFLTGSLLFGMRLWQQANVLKWVGVSLVAAVLVFVIIAVGRYHIVFWRFGEMIGFGVAGVVIGYRLWRCPTYESTMTVSSD
jgi:hypothetical protein